MILTTEQLVSYKNKGFAGPNPILSKNQLKILKFEINNIIKNLPSNTRPENIHSPNEYNPFLLELLLSNPFLDIAEQNSHFLKSEYLDSIYCNIEYECD